jgi:phytoene dehydrogenase-like protein
LPRALLRLGSRNRALRFLEIAVAWPGHHSRQPQVSFAVADEYDVVVVGSGPNGLAAAITLAEHECKVLVLEAAPSVGGGMRSAELTEPGFVHDVCSAVHPMALLSPFFRGLPQKSLGLTWVHPLSPLAHPLDHGRVGSIHNSLADTAADLREDAESYERHIAPLVSAGRVLFDDLLKPIGLTSHPLQMARFGLAAAHSAQGLARSWFETPAARALVAGCSAHSFLPLDAPFSSAIGLTLLMAAHIVGWPFAKGGSGAIARALERHLRNLGATIETGFCVSERRQIPNAKAIVFDTSVPTLLAVCADRLPTDYVERLRQFRVAPGVFKLDWALSSPIPWQNHDCALAGTVHIGGELAEIALAEAHVNRGEHPEKPFVLLTQPTLFDPCRAPAGKHIAWAYCHVPNGSTIDMTEAIEAQVDRFAPGFRDCIIGRHAMNTADFGRYNQNYVGGDITGGANDFRQLLMRPTFGPFAYETPLRGVYLCSSSTPPGGGVHGMCGYNAACAVLRQVFGIKRQLVPQLLSTRRKRSQGR